MCHDAFTCAMPHSYVPQLIRMRLIHMLHHWFMSAILDSKFSSELTFEGKQSDVVVDGLPSYVCHDSFIYAMTHSYVPWLILVSQDSCICANHSRGVVYIYHSHCVVYMQLSQKSVLWSFCTQQI